LAIFRAIVFAAALGGLVAGVFLTGIQSFKVLPLISQAEVFETAGSSHGHGDNSGHSHDKESQAEPGVPSLQFKRLGLTLFANVLTGIAFALMLTAGLALKGGEDVREGYLWGLAGFATFSLAPALGLPPELPGSAYTDLEARQIWWAATALATAVGIGLMVWVSGLALKVLGAVIIVAPHVVGAPHPESFEAGNLPAELAAAFVSATLVANLLFWLVIGGVSAHAYKRLAPTEPAQ
jgi:cobalt transporter subunit CbtA